LRRIILSSVACLPVPYFSHYLIHGTVVGRTLWNIKCVVTFSTTFVQNVVILRRIQGDVINVYTSSCKVPVILVRFQRNLYFLNKFSKKRNIKFHENSSSGSRVVACGQTHRQTDRHTDRQTDIMRLIVPICNFAIAPKNVKDCYKRMTRLNPLVFKMSFIVTCYAP